MEKKINPKYRFKKYYPPPPVIGTLVEYIDLNKDKNLRRKVTEFFYKKVLKWVSKYPEFKHLKKYSKKLESAEGFEIVYQLIRHFIKSYNINWYDLRDYYVIFKDFLRVKLLEHLK